MNPAITTEINLFKDFLSQNNDLGIIIGSHQNLDTVASALAMFISLGATGKNIQIISKKQPTVEVSNLVGIDKVKENFIGNTTKLVISLPYKKGEVEKVLFTEAPNTINFHLTAVAGQNITPFDVSDVKLNWEGGAPAAVITFGVGTIDELNGVIDATATKIVNIDNYNGNTRFGDVVLVDDSFSSLSEIVAKVIKDLGLPIDIDAAQNILDGVLYATRNFTKQNTSPLAFEAASNAMYLGATRKAEEVRPFDSASSNPADRQGRQDRQSQVSDRSNQVSDRSNRDFSQDRSSQVSDRSNRDVIQDRGNRDLYDSASSNPADRQGRQDRRDNRQQQGRPQPRVSDTDFPAMHMQGSAPRVSSYDSASSNPADRQGRQVQSNDNRRGNSFGRPQNNQPRPDSRSFGQRDNRPQQGQPQQSQAQFGANPNDVDALMAKIKAEQAAMRSNTQPYDDRSYAQNPIIQDAQMADEQPQMNQPMQSPMNQPVQSSQPVPNIQMPEETPYSPPPMDEIPDDWLMPKVFKSSKNNN